MKRVLLIGAGNLGSRHLQSIAECKSNISLTVFDPSRKSLEIARQRFEEMRNNDNIESIKYSDSFKSIPNTIDLMIVATNSDVRFEVTDKIIKNSKVNNIVFEKVLFQKIANITKMGKILDEKSIKAWVNCPRRMFPFYQNLKEELKNKKFILSVMGGDWGLACNGIHFVDLFFYLSGNNEGAQYVENIDDLIHESKRAGFIELTGQIEIQCKQNKLKISSEFDRTDPPIIIVTTDSIRYVIDEVNEIIMSKDIEKDSWKTESFKMYYQSELSKIFVDSIFETGDCMLTKYKESGIIHEDYIRLMLNKINRINKTETTVCPIT